jgi:hypothetical protein
MTKDKNTAKEGHHYVPQAYLERFTDSKGFLHIRDIARNRTWLQKPRKIMKIDTYYRQTWVSAGVDPDIFENWMASGPESEIKDAIDCLLETPEDITKEYAETLVEYLEIQRIRVPRQAAWAKAIMREAILKQIPIDVREEMNFWGIELTMEDSARFDYMRMALGTIQPWLGRMEWEIFEAEKGSSFITTDSPVSFYNPACLPPAEAGFGLAGTIVLFPLSSSKILLLRHPECRSKEPLTVLDEPTMQSSTVALSFGTIWDDKVVRDTNRILAHLAHELFVADSEATLWQAEMEPG